MVIKLLVFVLVFILLVPFGYGGGTAEIIFIRGKVELYSNSMQFVQIAKKGDSFTANQGIKTYFDGMLILKLEDGSVVKIDPNSVVLVENLIEKVKNKLMGYSGLQINAGGIMVYAHKSNYPRVNQVNPLFEIRYLNTVIELSKGKLLAGVDLSNNNLWVSVKEGHAKIINFVSGDYTDLKYGFSTWVEKGQQLSRPDKYAWPLRLNWQMSPEKNARLQSNFYALEITRQTEWNEIKKQANSESQKSYPKISSSRMQDLKNKKFKAEEIFAKFNSMTKPEKISILNDEPAASKNNKLQSKGQKGILDFN